MESCVLVQAKAAAKHSCEELVAQYLNQKPEDVHLVLCGDFGWLQWQNASAGKVLHQIILTKHCTRKIHGREVIIREGNYFSTSKGMEGEAFHHMLNWLEARKLMPYFKVMVCDQDSSVLCQLQEDL